MEHLIDKDALITEINKRRNKHFNSGGSPSSEYCYEDDEILNIIDTLEIKDVDLEKEYDNEFFKDPVFSKLVNRNAGISIAKYFFKLGMVASDKE